MITAKELADQISKAMEGTYKGKWSLETFTQANGNESGYIMCNGTIIAEIAGALKYCGNRENGEYIIAMQPDNMRVILSALADAERERDELRKDFGTLCKAVVGETGLSAIEEAGKLRARAQAAEAKLSTVRQKLSEAEEIIKGRDRAEAKLADENRRFSVLIESKDETIRQLNEEVKSLRPKLTEAVKVIEPFATTQYAFASAEFADDVGICDGVTLGDLRVARNFIFSMKGGES